MLVSVSASQTKQSWAGGTAKNIHIQITEPAWPARSDLAQPAMEWFSLPLGSCEFNNMLTVLSCNFACTKDNRVDYL